ncbi:MAG: hypothetical protein R2695_10515 [Acidimicrobiales bacterium]
MEVVDGTVRRLSPPRSPARTNPVSAAVTVGRAVRDGQADALCVEILGRVGHDRVVEIRTELVDVVALVGGDPDAARPLETHARCGDG